MEFLSFEPNLEILWGLTNLVLNMGLIEPNCLSSSHSLFSHFCKVFAVNLLKEFDLFNGRLFSANCGLECEEDICARLTFLS